MAEKRPRSKAKDPKTPRYYGVKLSNKEQEERWSRIIQCKLRPSRYADDKCTKFLGIHESVWKLFRRGGFECTMQGKWLTFKRMTLEFLATLTLEKSKKVPGYESISFNLNNQSFTLSIDELRTIFGGEDGLYQLPSNYNREYTWRLLSGSGALQEERPFDPRRDKASMIRNPVLRYIHRVFASSTFARYEGGTITTHELFIIWCMLKGHKIDVASFIIEHLFRAATRLGKGTISCGGMITPIAEYCGIEFEEWEQVKGGMKVDLQTLVKMQAILFDEEKKMFLIQKIDDYFPLPNKELTHLESWEDRGNLCICTEEHTRWIGSNRPVGIFLKIVPADVLALLETEGENENDQDEEGEDEEGEQDTTMEDAAGPSRPTERRQRRPNRGIRDENVAFEMTELRREVRGLRASMNTVQNDVGEMKGEIRALRGDVSSILTILQGWAPLQPHHP